MRFSARSMAATFAAFAVLFTQLAISALACPGPEAVVTPAAAHPDTAHCHQTDTNPSPLCPAHCAQGQQSLDKPPVPAIAPAVLIACVSWPATQAARASQDPMRRSLHPVPPAEPPPTLRNCCLRI
jgi:hypothetical protein